MTALLVSALAGLAILFLLLGFYKLREEQQMAERLQALVAPQSPAVTVRELELQKPFRERVFRSAINAMLHMAERMVPAKNLSTLQQKLARAGNPGGLSALDFVALRLLLAIIGAGIALFLGISAGLSLGRVLYAMLVLAVLAYAYPNIWLNGRIRKRQKEIQKALPDALDLLTIAVDAGLGLDAAMMKVVARWDNALTQEFRQVLREMQMGVPRAEALRHMAERTAVPELASFVAILVQSERLGASIINVLHAQADAMRMRRRQRAEEEAHKAPVKMMVPLVLFVFPALFIVIIGPAVPRVLAAFGK